MKYENMRLYIIIYYYTVGTRCGGYIENRDKILFIPMSGY